MHPTGRCAGQRGAHSVALSGIQPAIHSKHALIQDAAYQSLLRSTRQQVHQRIHLEEAIAHYTPEQRRAPVFRMGQDPGVSCRVHAARTLWLLGYPEQALARVHEALAFARSMAAIVPQFCREVPAVYEEAEVHTLEQQHEERYWEAEVSRLRGELLLRRSFSLSSPEECFRKALDVAPHQEAKACWQRSREMRSRPKEITPMKPLIAFNLWRWIEEHRRDFEPPVVPQLPSHAGSRPLSER